MYVFVESPTAKAIDAYKNATNGRFYQCSHLILVLLIYEILYLFSSHNHVNAYNGIDAWFKLAQRHLPGGTSLISLCIIGYLGYYVVNDWFGNWTAKEFKKAKEEARNKKKKLSDLRKKPLKDGGVNWYYWLFIILEGFVYGSFIRMLLPYFTYAVVAIVDPNILIPEQLDAVDSLRAFHTNFIQDLALAFGGGFYDEWIWRGLILSFAFRYFHKELGSVSVKDLKGGKVGLKVPKGSLMKFDNYIMDMGAIKKRKKNFGDRLPVVIIVSIFYAASHFIPIWGGFGDEFTLYNSFYRFFFAILMYFIFVNRKLPVVIWAHVVYDLWYFIFL